MSEPRPSLLPLMRSRNQLRLLATVVLTPTRVWSMAELVGRTGIPQPSVSRELRRLAEAGLVQITGRVNARQVQANTESVIFPELHSLMLKTVGPKPLLEDALQQIEGIERAAIFGSWARRYRGDAGSEPQDIDLLIIGRPDVDRLRAIVDHATKILGRDVNPTVLTNQEWAHSGSGFITQLHNEELVELNVHRFPAHST